MSSAAVAQLARRPRSARPSRSRDRGADARARRRRPRARPASPSSAAARGHRRPRRARRPRSGRRRSDAFSAGGVPSAITRPWSITAIRSASWSASSRYWVVSRTVVPAATSARTAAQTSVRPRGSSPVVGSSRNSTGGGGSARPRGRAAAASRRSTWPTGLRAGVREPEPLQQLVGAARARAAPEVVQAAEQHQVLPAAEHLVDRGVLADQPDPPADGRRVASRRRSRPPRRGRRRPAAGWSGSARRWSCPRRWARAARTRFPPAPPDRQPGQRLDAP